MTTGRPEPLDKFFPFSPFLPSVPPSPIPGLVLGARGTWLKGCNGEATYSLPYFTLLPPLLFPGCPKALNSTYIQTLVSDSAFWATRMKTVPH